MLRIAFAELRINESMFFAKALENIAVLTQLIAVQEGEELMKCLFKAKITQ